MAYDSSLEVKFVQLRKDIDNYVGFGEYSHAKMLIEQAMELCTKIYEVTPDPQKKQIMRDNAVKLKQMYEECKRRLGEADELTYDTPSNNAKTARSKPAASGGNKPAAKKVDDAQAKDGKADVNYVINGVNVEEFLAKDSNDVVTFDDVKGMDKEKALIKREFFLTDEQRAFNARIGKKPKTFILLYGVPGTGKTFFAKAISEELKRSSGNDTPFFSIVGSQLSDCKVGATEKNIQAVFEFCKQFEHCVLFIDEFDTIAPDRKQANGDPTAGSRVTTLLQMMDGFSSAKGTLVIAATNCPYNLDGAVLSRANARIEIPLPSYEVIYAVLHGKIGDMLDSSVDLAKLSAKLEKLGYSNRDIKNFIGSLQDSISDEFSRSLELGENRSPEDFRYTSAMVDKAFEEIVPTTKQSDIRRIEQFKQMGE